MAKLGKYNPKLTLPGEYVTSLLLQAQNPTPVVVRLQTGEKVQLLGSDKPMQPHRKSHEHHWETDFNQIKTIPLRLSLDGPVSIDSEPQTSHLVLPEGARDGAKLTRVRRKSTPPVNTISIDDGVSRDETGKPLDGDTEAEKIDPQRLLSPALTEGLHPSWPAEGILRSQSQKTQKIHKADKPETQAEPQLENQPEMQSEKQPETQRQSQSQTVESSETETRVPVQVPITLPVSERKISEISNKTQGLDSVILAEIPVLSDRASLESGSSQWLPSPQALLSFSPEDIVEAQTRVQIGYTLNEIVQSEYAYVKSLHLLGSYFIEPLIVKCVGLKITCTPLISMEQAINALRVNHEHFLTQVTQEKNLDAFAQEMTSVVAEPKYGSYAACAELLIFLVNRQVRPFELSYVSNLQTFLERNQPGERRMDLSLSLLLQKPMGRIAKYRLFLASLVKLCPEDSPIFNAMTQVNAKLTEINDEIKNYKERQAVLESVSEWLDLSDTIVPIYQFYGLLNFCGKCTVVWLTTNRKGPLHVISRECHVLIHDHHAIFAEIKVPKPLFILSYANCQLVEDPAGNFGGLYYDYSNAVKVVFEKEDCLYEVMLVSQTSEAHASLLKACESIPKRTLRYTQVSDSDIFIGPAIAQFDVNLTNPNILHARSTSCYFRQLYPILQRTPESRLASLGAVFRRGISWHARN